MKKKHPSNIGKGKNSTSPKLKIKFSYQKKDSYEMPKYKYNPKIK